MMTAKAMASQGVYKFARTWWHGLGLEFDGVNLGDPIEYDLLRVLGRQFANSETPPLKDEADNE